MGLQVKKFAARKIVVKYLSFLGGDSRPLAFKKQLRYTQLYTGRLFYDHRLIIDDKNNIIKTIANLNTFCIVLFWGM